MGTPMTAQTEVDRYINVITKHLSHAANNEAENKVERELLLECITTMVEELTNHANVTPDENVATYLAQHDSRFKVQPPIRISREALHDHAALQQAETLRSQVHDLVREVRSSRDAALTVAAEILHLEITSTLQGKNKKKKNRLMIEPKEETEFKEIPADLRQAIQDMDHAIELAKHDLEQWDPLPQHIRQLEELLVQINRGISIGPSQTQEAIDQVTDRLRNEAGPIEEELPPVQAWTTSLRL